MTAPEILTILQNDIHTAVFAKVDENGLCFLTARGKSFYDRLDEFFWGGGEYFDLSRLPPYRQSFSFGGQSVHESRYQIHTACPSFLSAYLRSIAADPSQNHTTCSFHF